MASTEIQALKIIWKNERKASLFKIAKELKISTDYSHLICRDLVKDKFVEFFEREYKITDLGKKELEKLGIIERIKTTTHPPHPLAKGGPLVIKPQKPKRKVRKITPHQKLRFGTGQAITKLSGLSPKLIEVLKKKGFKTLEDIATTSVSRLIEIIEGLKLQKAAEMINGARAKLRKEGKEYLWEK